MYLFQDFKNESLLKVLWGIFIVGNTKQAIFIYRLSSWLYNHKLKFFAYLLKSLNIILNSCDISPSSQIGQGIKMEHSVGIVIGNGVKIGRNLRIFQNVTIGARNGDEYPHIGDNATLYTGCAVLGKIEIGDNVTVGANAVLFKNTPSDATAVGVPARIISKEKNKAI